MDKDPQSWELDREAQRRYGKEVRKASKEAWRTFCRYLCQPGYSKLFLGTVRSSWDLWWLPSGTHTQFKGGNLRALADYSLS